MALFRSIKTNPGKYLLCLILDWTSLIQTQRLQFLFLSRLTPCTSAGACARLSKIRTGIIGSPHRRIMTILVALSFSTKQLVNSNDLMMATWITQTTPFLTNTFIYVLYPIEF